MSRVSQFSFAAGRINRNLIGRRDMEKYYNSAFEINNYVVKRHGVLEKRHGFKMTHKFKNGIFPQTRLIPFFWNNERCNYLAMSITNISVLDENGKLVSVIDYPESNNMSAWTPSEVNRLNYCQIGDIVFFASRERAPFRIRRRGVDDFVAEIIEFEDIARLSKISPVLSLNSSSKVEEADGSQYRTLKYRVSEVVGGKEVSISETLEIENVPFPWAVGGKAVLDVTQKSSYDVDGYRFYRNEGSGWGYIGTTEDAYSGLINSTPEVEWREIARPDLQWAKWIPDGVRSTKERPSFRIQKAVIKFYEPTDILSYTSEIDETTGLVVNRFVLRPVKFSQFKVDVWDKSSNSILDEDSNITVDISIDNIAAEYNFTTQEDGTWVRLLSMPEGSNIGEQFNETVLESINNEVTKSVRIESPTISSETDRFVYPYCFAIDETPIENGVLPMSTSTGTVDTASFVNDLMQFTDDYIQCDYSRAVPSYRNPFDSDGNYPGVVGVYQQRMVWASTKNDPSMFWMSVPGDIYNFSVHPNIQEDDMLNAALPLSRGPSILHMISHRYLIMLCENAECIVKAQGDSGLSYATISCEQQSYTGSSERVRPLLCGNAIIFCDRAGASAREYKYDYAMDAMAGRDLSVLNSELLERSGGIVDWTYQMFPDSIIWAVLADGTLAFFTYMPEQEVYAWSTATLPEGYKAIGVSCGDALQSAVDYRGRSYKMSSVSILASKDGDESSRYIFVVDGTSFNDIVENSEAKSVVGTVECVVPDSQGSTEARRKRVFRVMLRGENLVDISFGLRDRSGNEEPMSPSRQESSFVEAQLRSDYCYDPQIIIQDKGESGTVLMNLCTDLDCMDVGF